MNNAISKITHGMYVVTTQNGGCIVDTVCQISAGENPLITVAINKKNFTNELMHKENKFAISIIGMNTDKKVISEFGFKSMRDYNKFENVKTQEVDGLNIIPDAVAYLICEKVDMIENDTHTLFIGRVVNGEVLNDDKEISYNYYREHKDELLKVKTENNKTAWVCLFCGYVYYGEEVPNDFKCPWCGVGKELFQKKE